MRFVEQKISPLVRNMFPSFYQDEGENFVMFLEAYFEWLESNHQLLTLEDATNFNVGDTITQADVTGTIVAIMSASDILVLVDDLDTFKCYNVCAELIPVTSSSGGDTYITRGGTTKRLGPVFWSRNLMALRDIDTTMDLFIVRFKEKYLKNIEFDVQTNKELLIKNALNVYRSKGTERSIDLFFRLVYGTGAAVVYPGEQLFKLSAGEWVKPYYLEITGSSTERAISLVGKQITGLNSGASAFVEKYIKRKIKTGFVDVLFVSNVRGEFVNKEPLIDGALYSDSPKLVGSLSSVTITQGSQGFEIGDIVTFNSTKGNYGQARVSSVSTDTGIVDFLFLDGGYGYTVSADSSLSPAEQAKRTQSLVSEKVLALANVVTSNSISTIEITSGGSGYNNTDTLQIPSRFANASATLVTNSVGGIQYILVTNTGSGFVTSAPTVLVKNSSGGTSSGVGAVLSANAVEQDSYFNYFETVVQPMVTLDYNAATNASAFTVGSTVTIGNSTSNATGVILESSNTYANVGNLVISIANNGVFGTTGNSVTLATNSSVSAVINSASNTSAEGIVMGTPNTATFTLSTISGLGFDLGSQVYQLDSNNAETGNAYITGIDIQGTTGSIAVDRLTGIIRQGQQVQIKNTTGTADVTNIQATLGLYDIRNNFSNLQSATIYSKQTGTTANVSIIGQGYGASFKVGTITESETVYLNTDLLGSNNSPASGANQSYMSLSLSANSYGFPKSPLANSSSIIFSCLTFDSFTIGTIGSLEAVNPGVDYNIDPYVLAYQPYISGFNRRDYVITLTSTTGQFIEGEKILQTNTSLQKTTLVVTEETGFEPGDRVYQSNSTGNSAVGYIEAITPSTNTMLVTNVTGTFVTSSGSNSALISTSTAQTALVYASATNNQLYSVGSNVVIGQRIAFAGNSTNVIVAAGGQSGYIVVGAVDRAKLTNNDLVIYSIPSTNTTITGLATNTSYTVQTTNSTAIQLANSTGTVVSLDAVGSGVQQHQLIKVNSYAQVRLNANSTLANANGTMHIKVSNGNLRVYDSVHSTTNLEVYANAISWANSVLNTPIITANSAAYVSTAKGIVKQYGNNVMYAKRIQFENLFTANATIEGSQSGARATIVSVVEDDVLPIGFNAQIEANVITAEGSVTTLEIIDSGIGYANGEDVFFLSEDNARSGQARITVEGLGTGAGYYKTSKGFLSSISKIHDGDYYQEYSYEVISRIPFDKYRDMFKKVLHTAGTRAFGSVSIDDQADLNEPAMAFDMVTSNTYTINFNSNSAVLLSAIVSNNLVNATSSALKFSDGEKVIYTAVSGNSAMYPLVNNATYYVTSANSSSLKLATTRRVGRVLTINTNSSPNVLNVVGHNLVNGDYVTYATNATAIAGISNSAGGYYIITADSNTVALTRYVGGTNATFVAANAVGLHTLTTNAINIVANSTISGASVSGHYISKANEN